MALKLKTNFNRNNPNKEVAIKELKSERKFLTSFYILEILQEPFKLKLVRNKTTATKVINDFIRRYIQEREETEEDKRKRLTILRQHLKEKERIAIAAAKERRRFRRVVIPENIDQEFLKKNIHVKTKNGITLLHIRAAHGDFRAVKWLVKHRANVNAKDDEGRTALMYASENGHTKIVELLIQYGAIE